MSETPKYPVIHGFTTRIHCGPALAARVRAILPEVEIIESDRIIGDAFVAVTDRGFSFEGEGAASFEREPDCACNLEGPCPTHSQPPPVVPTP